MSDSIDDLHGFRAGVIAIVGLPNVGKSTFLNQALGQKVVITSERPQTTRDKIAGILSDDQSQIVFLDTPGIVDPRDLLHEALMMRIHEALEDVDGVLRLKDAARAPSEAEDLTDELLARVGAPIIEVCNKVDLLNESEYAELMKTIQARPPGRAFSISALKGKGVDELLHAVRDLLPYGPPLYPLDDLSDRDLRFLVAEIVREKVFELTSQEIPYGVATRTEEYSERDAGKDYIRVMIHVERESQKGIVIGGGGRMLKRIGAAARPEIEDLSGRPVFLELRVKVLKNWSKRPHLLRELGYRLPRNADTRSGKRRAR